jgi:hypothetical protein
VEAVVKVYTYAVVLPWHDDRFDAILSSMHTYANKLIELERLKRDRLHGILLDHYPQYAGMEAAEKAIEERLAKIDGEWRMINQQARRHTDQQVLRQQKRDAAARLKALRKQMSAYRAAHSTKETLVNSKGREFRITVWDNPEYQVEVDTVKEHHKTLHAHERKACGLPWGCYQMVEDLVSHSSRTSVQPKFRRWTGEGSMGTHLQGSAACTPQAALVGRSQWVRLRPIPLPTRKAARRNRRYYCDLRIGTERRKPIWLSVPIVMHREMPQNGKITWVKVQRRRVGTHYKYEVQFTLDADLHPDCAASGLVAVEVGYRLVPGGLRVATWIGDDGRQGELILPRDRVEDWWRPEQYRSDRDMKFDKIKVDLSEWLRANDHPGWLRKRCQHLAQWRSQARLAAVVLQWREDRFMGDEEMYVRLEKWRYYDRIQYDQQEHIRQHWIRWRRHCYREFAAELRRQYHTLAIKDVDWKKLIAVPAPDEEVKEATRVYYRLASPSALEQILKDAFAETLEVKGAYQTRSCSHCGSVEDFDQAEQYHTCESCGQSWDQDINAALNTLREARSLMACREPLANRKP